MTSQRRPLNEIMFVIATALGKFIFMDFLQWRLPYILVAVGGWTAYVAYRHRTSPGILKFWGIRTDNFWSVVKMILPAGIIAVSCFFLIGYYRQTLNLTWHILPVLLLYPLWGVVQQFLVIALVAGNLNALVGATHRWWIVVVTALLFGLLHYPHPSLMIGTFLLAIFYGLIFLRSRNIFALGLFHGWLGGLFFYTVVGRDPFLEIFGHF